MLINVKITLIISVFAIFIYFLFKIFIFETTKDFGRIKLKFNQKILGKATESIGAIKQIKLFSGEKGVCDEFENDLSYVSNKIIRFKISTAFPELFREIPLVIFCLSLVVYFS